MQIAEEEQHQQQQVVFNNDSEDSKMITMEEQMKDFSIQNKKRLKRSTSFDETEQMRWLDYGIESARAQFDYDPHVARLRALDLIYQFHA
ncbi:hypothetical protein QVD17_21545 [Tagetes erecta]|uniref:Uncharacterized protein n=1 Tax=Tagetes erecta TaxID=13708 RepID=A0AAD8KF51_TARER|nr:hypothetical protein QVD17_21545 [Tagetes erecta]